MPDTAPNGDQDRITDSAAPQEFFTISRPMLEAFMRASKSYYGSPGPGRERPHANSCGCGVCKARRWAEGVLNGT